MAIRFRLKTKDVFGNNLYLSSNIYLPSTVTSYPPARGARLYPHTLLTERLPNLITLDAEVTLAQTEIDKYGWVDGDYIGYIELAAGLYPIGELPYIYPYDLKFTISDSQFQYFQAGMILIRLDSSEELKTSCVCRRMDYQYLKEIGETDVYVLRSGYISHGTMAIPNIVPHYREMDYSRNRKLLEEFTEDTDISIVSSDSNIVSLTTSVDTIEVVKPDEYTLLADFPANGDQVVIQGFQYQLYMAVTNSGAIAPVATDISNAAKFTLENVSASGSNVTASLSIMLSGSKYYLNVTVSGTSGTLSLRLGSGTNFTIKKLSVSGAMVFFIYYAQSTYGYYITLGNSGTSPRIVRDKTTINKTSYQNLFYKFTPGETTEIEYVESKATANAKGNVTITTDIPKAYSPLDPSDSPYEQWSIDVIKEESKPKFYYGNHPVKAIQYGTNDPISLKEPSIEPVIEDNVLIGTLEV